VTHNNKESMATKKQQCITTRSQGIVAMHNNDEEKNSNK
jgi:hypothetical protein